MITKTLGSIACAPVLSSIQMLPGLRFPKFRFVQTDQKKSVRSQEVQTVRRENVPVIPVL